MRRKTRKFRGNQSHAVSWAILFDAESVIGKIGLSKTGGRTTEKNQLREFNDLKEARELCSTLENSEVWNFKCAVNRIIHNPIKRDFIEVGNDWMREIRRKDHEFDSFSHNDSFYG